MSHIYSFEFPGTREMFLSQLKQYPNSGQSFYRIDDCIVTVSDDGYTFGIEKGGHSGGYWFKPTVTETDGKLVFKGAIEDIRSIAAVKEKPKEIAKKCLLFVLLLPILLPIKIYQWIHLLIERIKAKIKKQPLPKKETAKKRTIRLENRLAHLMVDILNCVKIDESLS